MAEQFQSSATARRMMLGARLRTLREQQGISRAQAGYTIRASESKMSRLELGKVSFKERDIADLLMLYGITDPAEREAVLAMVREANRPGWWRSYEDVLPDWFQDYVGLEQAARRIRTYETHFVPGLLQTDDYSRAVISSTRPRPSGPEIDRAVDLRATRKQLINRDDPPRIWAVVEEAALRRPVGSDQLRRDQLEHLLKLGDKPHITIQILPVTKHAHAAAGGAFTILRFGETELPDIVYVENLLSALYLDRRDHVSKYSEVMDQLSVESLRPKATAAFITEMLAES